MYSQRATIRCKLINSEGAIEVKIYEVIGGFQVYGLTLKGRPVVFSTRRAAELALWASTL